MGWTETTRRSKINITIERSEEWRKTQQLERGENIPERITVPVEVSELSLRSRELLLATSSYGYQDTDRLRFDTKFLINPWTSYGRSEFFVDSDSPTVAEINAAIEAAGDLIDAKRREHVAALAAKQEQERQRVAARELLADEFQSLNNKCKTLHDKCEDLRSRREAALADRQVLADFLAAVPDDAKRGTLKSLVADGRDDELDALRKRIEDASPVWIFRDEDED